MKIFCDISNIKVNLKNVKLFSHCVKISFISQWNMWKLKEKWWNMKEENVAFKVIAARSG